MTHVKVSLGTGADHKAECGYADKYKAIRKPTCGCKICNDKWFDRHKGALR